MLFHTYTFLFAFLPVVWAGYFLLGRFGTRVALAWLVTSSLFFYGWWEPRYLVLLGFSMSFNFSVGWILTAKIKRSKALLVAGVIVNLGLLAYFKYANFLVDTVNRTAGTEYDVAPIILPLAISFFTFQQIAYLVDAYRSETREHDFLSYALFVTFFPQLIAGPIVHHREMLPQFARRESLRPSLGHLSVGITMFAMGLFKKIILADGVSGWANQIFDGVSSASELFVVDAWLGVLAYTFQIYFDFSGYSDMAIGLGRMFGIRLPMNFNSPYRATSIVEFWRRWHMTLSRFLRDYLYFALGGNRLGPLRRHANLFVTMLLGGLWHGAGWTFVIWGGLHGLYLIANHAWDSLTRRADGSRSIVLPLWVARTLTFGAVIIAWVFFRADSLDSAVAILSAMIGSTEAIASSLPVGEVSTWMLVLLLIAWFAPNSQQWLRDHRPVLEEDRAGESIPIGMSRLKWQPNITNAIFVATLCIASFIFMHRVREFLYFQF